MARKDKWPFFFGTNWCPHSQLNPCKTWEGLKRNSRKKNKERFNTACCCFLMACHTSFKRGFPDSAAAAGKKDAPFWHVEFLGRAASMSSSSFMRPGIWMGFVRSMLKLAYWLHVLAVCLEVRQCMQLICSKQPRHAGLCGESRLCCISLSNDAAYIFKKCLEF